MRTLDVNTNYSNRGGGIRTYHRAKIDWFNRQRRQRYYLVVPGPKRGVRRIGPRAVRIEAWGPSVGSGYRFLLDYWTVLQVIRRLRPEVVEAGDPFLTGLILLAARRVGWLKGWLTAFYHSDPIETWAVPWTKCGGPLRRMLASLAAKLFYAAQRGYDLTVVTSRAMEQHLLSQGVTRLVRKPLGTHPIFFADSDERGNRPASEAASARPLRMLFVGRLVQDKAADVLWQALPRIMRLPGAELTVIGGGPLEAKFAQARFRGYQYLGYVADRAELARVYREHDLLLAPGPYETFGLAVLEGLASGLVVVGPDRGGTAEMLTEMASPFVFRSGDVEDFVTKIEQAAQADLQTWSARGRELAERYGTWDDAIERLMTTYLDLGQTPPRALSVRNRRDDAEPFRPTGLGRAASADPAAVIHPGTSD